MSFVARSTRSATRIISRTRPYSVVVDAPSSEWVAKREAIKHHAQGNLHITWTVPIDFDHTVGTTSLWRRIRFV
jgi:hypothetical protein